MKTHKLRVSMTGNIICGEFNYGHAPAHRGQIAPASIEANTEAEAVAEYRARIVEAERLAAQAQAVVDAARFAALTHPDTLAIIAERDALRAERTSPGALRRLLRRAEAEQIKAKAAQKLARQLARAADKLQPRPKIGLVGNPSARIELPKTALGRRVFEAVPPAHRHQWHGKYLARFISKEAARAFSKFITA